MGMYNAILPTNCSSRRACTRNGCRQSALYYEATQVAEPEARAVYDWLSQGHAFPYRPRRGDGSHREPDPLAMSHVHRGAAHRRRLRLRDDRHPVPAGAQGSSAGVRSGRGPSHNSDRPPVRNRRGKVICQQALPNFNEVDECSGLDGLLSNRVHAALKQPVRDHAPRPALGRFRPERQHGRLCMGLPHIGQRARRRITSMATRGPIPAPTAHVFPPGRRHGSRRGQAGEIVWSRIFVEAGKLKMDLGRAHVVALPKEDRAPLKETPSNAPIMHAVTYGVSRDQMMARHKATTSRWPTPGMRTTRISRSTPRRPSPVNSAVEVYCAAPAPMDRRSERARSRRTSSSAAPHQWLAHLDGLVRSSAGDTTRPRRE